MQWLFVVIVEPLRHPTVVQGLALSTMSITVLRDQIPAQKQQHIAPKARKQSLKLRITNGVLQGAIRREERKVEKSTRK